MIPMDGRLLTVVNLFPAQVRRSISFIILTIIIIFVPLKILRWYQELNVKNILQTYNNTDLVKLSYEILESNNKLFIKPVNMFYSDFVDSDDFGLKYKLVVAKFLANNDNLNDNLFLKIKYENRSLNGNDILPYNFSHSINVKLYSESGFVKVYFPAMIFGNDSRSIVFTGLELNANYQDIFKGIFKVADTSSLPLIMTVQIPTTGFLFKQVKRFEVHSNSYDLLSNRSVAFNTDTNSENTELINEFDIEYMDDNVHWVNEHLIIDGIAEMLPGCKPQLYNRERAQLSESIGEINDCWVDTDLFISNEQWLNKGDYAFIEGILFSGGITFGIFQNEITAGYLHITDRGKFIDTIKIVEDGWYKFGISNNLDVFNSLENRLTISSLGYFRNFQTNQFSSHPLKQYNAIAF